jgi:ferric-dicitrate binding protein FerR (iron transport regulator)
MDNIGRLIKLAGAREAVPPERFERVRQNVHSHWQQVVAEQRATRRPWRFKNIAVAASFILVAGATLILWNLEYKPAFEPLATVDRVLGLVQIGDEYAGKNSEISADTPIITGANGRIALRLSGGQSLRIDTSSHVIVHSPSHISLEAGAIYIDTAFSEETNPILVSTPLGSAQDIGTQFQVRLTGMALVVGVRQGLVEVSQPGQQNLSVNKGYSLELAANGESGQQPLHADDPDWAWIETVTPEFDIEGASLAEYLQWYASERGVELVWADTASESKANAAILAGSISGSSLDEGLLLVKKIAPFEHRLSTDRLWIKVE